MENWVISGLKINHRSYASAVRPNDSENSEGERETHALENVVSDFINEHITEVDISEICACHMLPTLRKRELEQS